MIDRIGFIAREVISILFPMTKGYEEFLEVEALGVKKIAQTHYYVFKGRMA